MTSEKSTLAEALNLAQDVINASDCAVGMLDSLASMFAGIQAMAGDHASIQQLAMLGQEVIDGYRGIMESYKDKLPEAVAGGAK